MKRNFVTVAQFLQQEFPHDLTPPRGQVTGGLYPPPAWVDTAAQVLQLLQMLGLVWMFMGGEKVCGLLGFPRDRLPSFYYTIQNNGTAFLMALFLFIPQVLSKFQATGAFEIYYNDQQLIFSRLQRQAFPTAQELVDGLIAVGLTPGRPAGA